MQKIIPSGLYRLREKLEFPSKLSFFYWCLIAILLVPLTTYFRLRYLSNILVFEPHGRQMQTALTTYYFANGQASIFDYRSPFEGHLWNYVYEFPLYQWISAQLMSLGLSIEVASRSTCLFFFILSMIVFALLVLRLFGKQTAAWATLLYWIIPFNVLFSRAGLIDFTALFFQICAFWLLVESFQSSNNRSFYLFTLGFCLSGTLAALVKITVWIFPFVALFFILLFHYRKTPLLRKQSSLLLLALVIQFVASIFWLRWTESLSHSVGANAWTIGFLSDRFNPAMWANILHSIRSMILNDWLIIPFLIGTSFTRKNRHWLWLSLALIIAPILLFFRVSASNHDYYFIIGVPYFMLLAGIGLSYIFTMPKKQQYSLLVIISLLFAYRFFKMKYIYGGMWADLTPQLLYSQELKKYTAPKDIVLISQELIGGGLEIPLYSERLVKFIKGHTTIPTYPEPSVFVFDTDMKHLSDLSKFEKVWIDGNYPSFFLYRIKEQLGFSHDLSTHLTAFNATAIPVESRSIPLPTLVNLCEDNKAYLVIKLGKIDKSVRVQSLETATELNLPPSNYLSVPGKSKLGCRFDIGYHDE